MNCATSNASQASRLDSHTVDQTQHRNPPTYRRAFFASERNQRARHHVAGSGAATAACRPKLGGNSVAGVQYLPVVQQFTRYQDQRTHLPILVWQVNSAGRVTIGGQPVSAVGRQTEGAGSATYRLSATNKFGTVLSTLTVSGPSAGGKTTQVALLPPSIKSFAIQPASGNAGSRLTWQTSGAHLALINGKRVGLSGALAIAAPRSGQTYDLVADNGYLTAKSSLHLSITGGKTTSGAFVVALPKIKSFALTGTENGKFLSWQVVGALHTNLGGKVVSLTGRAPAPPGSKTLILEATNDAGTTRAVVIISAPSPTNTKSPTPTPASFSYSHRNPSARRRPNSYP